MQKGGSHKKFLIHFSVWLFVSFLMYATRNETNPGSFWKDVKLPFIFSSYVFFGMVIPFYISWSLLTPDFLNRKEKGIFYFANLMLYFCIYVAMSFLITRLMLHYFFSSAFLPDSKAINQSLYTLGVNAILCAAIAAAIRITHQHFVVKQQLAIAEKERIAFELNFLRSQINPHFLFNALNNIYFQISPENDKARDTLHRLSSIMRYMLYESNDEYVSLSKEISYLQNYFEIQKLRNEESENFQLHTDIKHDQKIRPHLILPLIENAFKHKSSHSDSSLNFVTIDVRQIEHNSIDVLVVNSFERSQQHIINNKGIGIENLIKRLRLFYPGKELLTIDIDSEQKLFTAHLIIPYEN